MKKIVLICFAIAMYLQPQAQQLDDAAAKQLVSKNLGAVGISRAEFEAAIISNAYKNKSAGTEMVYLQQGYQGTPVLNHLLVLAFKEGQLLSRTGTFYKAANKGANDATAKPLIDAGTAARTALAHKKLDLLENLQPAKGSGSKIDFGLLNVTKDKVMAELLWVVDEGKLRLVWQVIVSPKKSADYFLVRIDARQNIFVGEDNLTLYCNFGNRKHSEHGAHPADASTNISGITSRQDNATIQEPNSNEQANFSPLSPSIVNNASYRVIPFPAESPSSPGGAPAIVNNPWTSAPGNATSLKWHSDGTNDYNYTRGNNVWAYHDRSNQNSTDITKSATSTTPADPLTFNFVPDFTKPPFQTTPAPNQQFNVTNLFYWNNVVHDVAYQYGFDEASGNFQANNQGRGGIGNDFVRAEAQDGSGSDNANFNITADGNVPRMQMYLWNGVTKMVISSPASIAGSYPVEEGTFSTANMLLNIGILPGQIVYYDDDIGGTMHEACGAPTNSVTGKIALINRGNCNFSVKVKNAQTAGAIGVIIINNIPGPAVGMGGTDNTITIPAVMVSQSDGALIAAQVANNISVTLSNIAYDGDVDNGIVVHEYAHGISGRLTGGASQPSCLTSAEQMGEGWSDYYMLMLTQNWGTSNVNTGFNTTRSVGTYAVGEVPSGLGIRTKRYSTNFDVNDLVYNFSIPGAGQQHDRGEIWCATLWDMTWNIIQQLNSITPDIYNASGTGGNVIALKLVTEGLKLQPCNPGFIDGRDAILKADQILYNGKYSCAIREAFRRRGMGALASQGSAQSTTDQLQDFTPYLSVNLRQNVTQIPEGQNIIYTNSVTSCGPLTNYLLTDTLPANVTYVSGGTYNAGTRVVSFPVNFTGAGSQNFVFTVKVNNGSYYTPTTYLNEQVASATLPATLTTTSTVPASLWTVSTAQSKSAPYSLFTPDQEGVSEQLLTTVSPISLGTNQSSFSFWHNFNTENGWDGGVVQVSTDNGGSWIDLENNIVAGYYNTSIDPTNGIAISGKKAFTGATNGFINTSVNLSAYAGQSVKLRWAFYSDAFEAGVGWYVDDILVKNEAVVNMRTSLFSGGQRVEYRDTVTVITPNLACTDATITTDPIPVTVCGGTTANFTTAATGSTLNYQWQVSTDGGLTYTNLASATNTTLSLAAVTPAMNNNRYRVIARNACPSADTSLAAILTVTTPTAISTQPANVSTCAGTDAAFTVVATGSNLTYQWQVSTNGGTSWTAIAGATSATLNLTAVTASLNNNQYRVLLPSCVAGGVTSNAATLIVSSTPTITTQPTNMIGCAGGNVSFSAAVNGSSLTFQWQVSTDGGNNWVNLAGATSNPLTLTAVTAAMNDNRYRLLLNSSCGGGQLITNAASLTINNEITLTQQPTPLTLCSGLPASFTVAATGSGVTYQWQVSTNGGTVYTNIAGATSATLTLPAVLTTMNNNQYRAAINGTCVSNLFSNSALLNVNGSVNIVTQPANQVACAPVPAVFTVNATGSNLTYQWEVSTNSGSSWTALPGAITNTITVPSLTADVNGNQYRVVIAGAPCGTLTSRAATLSVGQLPTVTITASTLSVTPTTTALLTATPSPAGTYSYQWFKNDILVPGITTNTLVVNVDNAGTYKVIASTNGCNNVSNELVITGSGSIRLYVYPNPNHGLFQVRFYTDPSVNLVRTINIYEPRGAKIFTKVYTVLTPYDKMEVNLGGVPAGVYYVELLDATGKKVASAGVTKF